MAEAQIVLRNFSAALQLWNEALHEQVKRLGMRNLLVAKTLFRRGEAQANSGNFQDALADLEMSLEIRRSHVRSSPKEELEIADTLVAVSALQQKIQNYVEAEASIDEVLSIRKRALGPIHESVAAAYCTKGTYLHQRRRYVEARQSYAKALVTYRALGLSEKSPSIEWLRRFTAQRNIQSNLFWRKSQGKVYAEV